MGSDEQKDKLHELFLACDVDRSGRIEKWEFVKLCTELHVRSTEVDALFSELDSDKDGTINVEEFMKGFQESHLLNEDTMSENTDESGSGAWEDFKSRLEDQVKFIPRIEQVSTLYQNINLTEPRMISQFERVLISFIKEIRILNTEMEHLALAVKRAQDQSAIQLSEMEEEMDHRIHTTERNTRLQESKKAETALCSMKHQYETQICELQQKIQTLQMIENQNKSTSLKEETSTLKRKNNEILLQNQKLKQELLVCHTNVAFLQSELDSLKSDLTDQSINCERDEALMKCFSEERENLERQIEILQAANRKLHDSNDGLRGALENSQSKSKTQRVSGLSPGVFMNRSKTSCVPYFDGYCNTCADEDYDQFRLMAGLRRHSCESLALALCDPMRRLSCEEDSLPDSCVDSGMSTLRSNNGYEFEHEGASCHELAADNCTTVSGDTSDTEVLEVRDEVRDEAASGSHGESAQSWAPSQSNSKKDVTASGKKCLSAILTEREKDEMAVTQTPPEKAYRIVLAGDAAVGKSSFLLRLCKNEFKGNTSATLGVDFQMKTLVVDGIPTVLQLWDTAGQERFRSIAKSYFRRADGVLLLYDVTCEKSFLNVREWVDIIEDVSHDDIPIMLVGNKTDMRTQALQEGETCIPTSYGEKLAMTYSALFCETSAKDGSNIIEAVLHLAREVTKHAEECKEPISVAKLSRSPNKMMSNENCCMG
ncbi:ras and EF-hand domain-containing protein homolog isoform X2 [Triplophysa dalaica]|uniref:ras and EF-hand domain-containing protein homolog isoform X2 n=2 Tax=Triplophysa dalaica TaxID=1582913 RepID=UPI0024DF496F|nr:ras and EF-hand domain-containing protein homolog isoform X2 [Triplophysa dalaica]